MSSKAEQAELIGLSSQLIDLLEKTSVPVFFIIGESGERRYTLLVASEKIDGESGNGKPSIRLLLPDGSPAPRGEKKT